MGFRSFVCVLNMDVLIVVWLGLVTVSEGIQVTPGPAQELQFPGHYRDYYELEKLLAGLAANYSDFASVYSIGQSVENRELWVLKIKSPRSPVVGVPNVKFVGNIHGNEPVGGELILRFAEYLLKNYDRDEEVNWIMNRAVFHLLPSLNPDGFQTSREGVCYSGPGRENRNSVDLNRNFPNRVKENIIQPETAAVVQWMSQVPFLLSASFHGGALVANYPFDSTSESEGAEALVEEITKNISRGENLMDIWRNLTPDERDSLIPSPSLTPDDDVFRYLARTYSDNHLTMHKGRTCNENQPSFPGGITNGAAWYSFTGGMQDYNYEYHGCMELTLEISCCKYPQAMNLPRLWAENKRAMMELAKQSQLGVKGAIMDKTSSAPISGAVLQISGRENSFRSTAKGEFWRILLPGQYIVIVKAKGYKTQSFPFDVSINNRTHPEPTWLNIYLQPADNTPASTSSNTEQMTANWAPSESLSLFLFSTPLLVLFNN